MQPHNNGMNKNPLSMSSLWNSACSGGFTLLEALVVVAIIAILAALAAPAFNSTLDKQRITGAVEAIATDLRLARAESIKRNRIVKVTFSTGSNWSYTVHADPDGSNELLKTVNGSDFFGTTLDSAAFGGDDDVFTLFNPTRGDNLMDGATTLTSEYFSATVTVSLLGRIRICGTIDRYPLCS